MFVITRTFKLSKEDTAAYIEDLKRRDSSHDDEGFVRIEATLDETNKDYNLIRIASTWMTKDHFKKWHAGPEHRQAHQNAHLVKKDYTILERTITESTLLKYFEKK